MKFVLTILCLTLLSACYRTVPVKLGNDFVYEEPAHKRGLVYIYWPNSASLERGTETVEIIFDHKIINLPVGSYTALQLSPGKYPIVLNDELGEVTIKEGQRIYFEIQYNRKYSLFASAITRTNIYSGNIGAEIFDSHRTYIEYCKRFDISDAEKLFQQRAKQMERDDVLF